MANGAQDKIGQFDTRAILALISIFGAFIYQGFLLYKAGAPDSTGALPQIPSWMSAITMGVIGFYFGSKAGGGQENGIVRRD